MEESEKKIIRELIKTQGINLLNDILPKTEAFVKIITPHIEAVRVIFNYKEFLNILKKIGLIDLNGYAEKYCNSLKVVISSTSIDDFIDSIIEMAENAEQKKSAKLNENEFFELFGQEFSKAEKIIPYNFHIVNTNNYPKHWEQSNKLLEALSEKEIAIYNSFDTLFAKLMLKYLLCDSSFPEGIKLPFAKNFFEKFFKSLNTLYGNNFISNDILDYLEQIPVPNLEQWKQELQIQEAKIETIPSFHQIEETCLILNKYVDSAQQNDLFQMLKSGTAKSKIIFKGKANQLADVFKQLDKFNLITGCTKNELIVWIQKSFLYTGINNKIENLTESHLHSVISGENKPCKNPILHIEKDTQGKFLFRNPEKKRRSN